MCNGEVVKGGSEGVGRERVVGIDPAGLRTS